MNEAENTILEVNDLTVEFRSDGQIVRAVDSLSFSLKKGEILGLVGESGSGKSVTGMSLLRLIPEPIGKIVAGEALFRGNDLLKMPIDQLKKVRGKEIGIIFQEPMTALSPLVTVGKQMVEALLLHFPITRNEAHSRSVEWLTKVGIPDPVGRMSSYPFEFSGGMRQRVMIAMVLMLDPAVIVADEPTTALDVTTQRQIFELILKVRRKESSILFITHDMGVIWQLCDRVMVMEKSRKVEVGELRELFQSPKQPYTRKLLNAVPRLTDAPKGNANTFKDEPLFVVNNLRTWYPKKSGVLSRVIGHVKAIDDVSCEIRKGETLALVGESGSGKSTFGRTLLGLEKAHSGEILYKGKDLVGLSSKERRVFSRHMQVVFQDPFSSLNPRQTVLDILTEGLEEHGLLDARNKTDIAASLLEEVELKADYVYRYPHEFSGGQRQRICIARAISLKPEFIILDEAVSALDVTIQAQVIDLLMSLQDKFGLTYLFISHDLSVVKRIADRTIVLKQGKILEQGLTSQVIGNPQNEYTKELLSAVPIPGDEPSRLSLRTG